MVKHITNEDLISFIDDKLSSMNDKLTNIELSLSNTRTHTFIQYIIVGILAIGLGYVTHKTDKTNDRVDTLVGEINLNRSIQNSTDTTVVKQYNSTKNTTSKNKEINCKFAKCK